MSSQTSLLAKSGIGQLTAILEQHLKLMEIKDATVEKIISAAMTASSLREAKKKALENEKTLLLSIMEDIDEMNTFLKNIILIENLFNSLYQPYKQKQEEARAKYAENILKYENKPKCQSEAGSFVELIFGGQTHISSFQTWLDKVAKQCDIQNVKIKTNSGAKVKKIERAFYKAFYVYSEHDGFKEMTDILRCSFVFDDFENLYKCFSIIEMLAEQTLGGILRVKDRYHPSTIPFGYRDLLINIYCPNSKIVAEIQLHFTEFYKYKKISHKMYKRARLFERDTGNLAYEYSTKFMRPKIGTFKVYEVSKDEIGDDDDHEDDNKKEEIPKTKDMKYDELLKQWGLDKYVDKMLDEGWEDPADWKEVTDDDLKNDMGFSKGHIKKFRRKYKEWLKQIEKEENEDEKEDIAVYQEQVYENKQPIMQIHKKQGIEEKKQYNDDDDDKSDGIITCFEWDTTLKPTNCNIDNNNHTMSCSGTTGQWEHVIGKQGGKRIKFKIKLDKIDNNGNNVCIGIIAKPIKDNTAGGSYNGNGSVLAFGSEWFRGNGLGFVTLTTAKEDRWKTGDIISVEADVTTSIIKYEWGYGQRKRTETLKFERVNGNIYPVVCIWYNDTVSFVDIWDECTEWDTAIKPANCSIDHNDRTLCCSGTTGQWEHVIGKQGGKRLKYRVKLDKIDNNDNNVCIGIIAKPIKDNTAGGSYNGNGSVLAFGSEWFRGNGLGYAPLSTGKQGRWKTNDIITVEADVNTSIIKYEWGFGKNKRTETLKFERVVGNIYPVVCIWYKNDTVTLLDVIDDGIDGYCEWNQIFNAKQETVRNITIMAEICVSSNAGNGRIGVIVGTYPKDPNINVEVHTNGRLRFFWNNGEINLFGNSNLCDGKKHIVGFVRDCQSSKICIYLDGKLETTTNQIGSDKQMTNCFLIGKDYRYESMAFKGDIFKINIYSKAFDQDMILNIMNKWKDCNNFIRQIKGGNDYEIKQIFRNKAISFKNKSFTLITLIRIASNTNDSSRVGVILGTYPKSPNINFEVHQNGRCRLFWNNGQIDIKGQNKNLNDGKKHCVIFMRDVKNKNSVIYVDGEIECQYGGYIGNDFESMNNCFLSGRDYRFEQMQFKGDILRLNAYSTQFDEKQIKQISDQWLGKNIINDLDGK